MEDELLESCENRETLSKLGFGLDLRRFLNFLTLNGIFVSVAAMIGGGFLVVGSDYPDVVDDIHVGNITTNASVVTMWFSGNDYIVKSYNSFTKVYTIFLYNGLILLAANLILLKMKTMEDKMKVVKILCYVLGVEIIFTFPTCVPVATALLFYVTIEAAQVKFYTSMHVVVLMWIIYNLTNLVFLTLKILGIRKEKRSFIKAFVIYKYVCYITLMVGIFSAGIVVSVANQDVSQLFTSLALMFFITYLFISYTGYVIVLESYILNKDLKLHQDRCEMNSFYNTLFDESLYNV